MSSSFQFAGGSVMGRSHRIAGKNNQDALCIMRDQECTVAIVCDGCGSGGNSEVGAHLGARLVAQSVVHLARGEWPEGKEIISQCDSQCDVEVWLEQARQSILAHLRPLTAAMGDSWLETVNRYFLFTVVGALLTPSCAVFFSLGDGVLAINGEVKVLGPFPGNAPPYLGYSLVENTIPPELLRLQLHRVLPLQQLDSFLLGTDGVCDVIQRAELRLPGKVECVGPLSQFWQEERYFNNPDMVRRRLASIARDTVARTDSGMCKEAGLLRDDTTLVVGRRITAETEVQNEVHKEVHNEKRE